MCTFLLPHWLISFYVKPEPLLPLTCVEERAKGERAVLLVEGEVEDVQSTDAGHPHRFSIYNVTVISHIRREAFHGLIHTHARWQEGREANALGFTSV